VRSATSRALRALPTLLRVGVAETVAYRAEFLVWMLTSTMPLVMLALMSSIARERPFKGYTEAGFVTYYLSVLIVRQLTGNWVAWQMGEEIRNGSLAMRRLRPIHPFIAFASSHAAAIPFRSVIALPIAIILLVTTGAPGLANPLQLALLVPSIAIAWMLTFAILFAIGSLSFWITQSMAVANLYFGLYTVLSGYLIKIDMMGRFAKIISWLPFRFMLSAPVELITDRLTNDQILEIVGGQLAWTAVIGMTALSVWRAGVRHFEAVGG